MIIPGASKLGSQDPPPSHAEPHDPPPSQTQSRDTPPSQAQSRDTPPSQAGSHAPQPLQGQPQQADPQTCPPSPPAHAAKITTGTTLLIGSSLIKHVKPKSLHHTLVQTMRGATVLDAYHRLSNTTLGPYSQIILQFGSNDLDRRPELVTLEYKMLLSAIKLNAKPNSKIYISAIPPRLDRRAKAAKSLNCHLSGLADPEANIFFVCHADAFFTTAGVSVGLSSYLARDRYHLNTKGTEVLLSSLNDRFWYGRKLQCRICHIYGHKASVCFQRHQPINQEIPVLDSLDVFPPLPAQIGVEQVTPPQPNFPEKRIPYKLPQGPGNTFQIRPVQCPTMPRNTHSVQESPRLPQTAPTTIPVVRLTTPVYPMVDELSVGANPYQFGTRPAPQWYNTAPVYPMVDELPFHASSYQFGTQHAWQWSNTHQDCNYVSQYHIAEIDQHSWPHLSYKNIGNEDANADHTHWSYISSSVPVNKNCQHANTILSGFSGLSNDQCNLKLSN